eukprot:6864575-Prymnesium_polylepis.1
MVISKSSFCPPLLTPWACEQRVRGTVRAHVATREWGTMRQRGTRRARRSAARGRGGSAP